MDKAFFLDRDGVLIEEEHYISDPAKVRLCAGVPESLRRMRSAGYKVIIISNQAGIAYGMYGMDDVKKVENKIRELLAPAKIDAFYYCPHHPEHSGECLCRKPNPGMLLKAAEDLNIDIKSSLMIGDRMSDVNAGRNAGCRKSYLVRTGYGKETLNREPEPGCPVSDNAYTAFMDFIKGEK